MSVIPQAKTVAGAAFDVERIRADFPILGRLVYGKPLVYLDNAASAQKPKPVLEAIRSAYEDEYANVHRGLHFLSNTATQNFEDARESVRRFLNAPAADQIVFTRNATEGVNLVAQSFLRPRAAAGDFCAVAKIDSRTRRAWRSRKRSCPWTSRKRTSCLAGCALASTPAGSMLRYST